MQCFLIHPTPPPPPPPKGVLSYSASLSVAECLLSIYVSRASVIKCGFTSILCQRLVYSGLLHSSVFFGFFGFFLTELLLLWRATIKDVKFVCTHVESSDQPSPGSVDSLHGAEPSAEGNKFKDKCPQGEIKNIGLYRIVSCPTVSYRMIYRITWYRLSYPVPAVLASYFPTGAAKYSSLSEPSNSSHQQSCYRSFSFFFFCSSHLFT